MNQGLFDDLAQIGQDLAQLFPGLPNIEPLRYLASGAISVVVETSGGVIFRLGKNVAAAASYEREARLLLALHPYLDLPIPKPRWCAAPSPQFPFGVFGYPKLVGAPLHRRYLEALDWRHLAADIAAFLYQLHNSPVAQFSELGLPTFHGRPEVLTVTQSKVLPYLKLVLATDEYKVVVRWWDELLIDHRMQDYESVLVHGDLFYANILLDEATSTVTAVVDFENSTLGDPAQDFAVQYHMGRAFAEAVITAYQRAGGTFDSSFEHRVHQLWILREFAGLEFFIETNDVTEFAYCVWKLRNGPLFLKET